MFTYPIPTIMFMANMKTNTFGIVISRKSYFTLNLLLVIYWAAEMSLKSTRNVNFHIFRTESRERKSS